MTRQQSKWNADAEAAMMGFTVPVQSEEHLKHITGYVIHTLQGMFNYPNAEAKTAEVVENALHRYNSERTMVKFFNVTSTHCGVHLTFVRDDEKLTSKNGVLAWVENLDYPDCSELGYVFFDSVNGVAHRVA